MKISKDLDINVGFKFNGIFIEVTPRSTFDELAHYYHNEINKD